MQEDILSTISFGNQYCNMNKKILVIGSSNTDMTIKAPRIPAPGETILGGEFKMGPGGKGANQAVAAARLGGDVSFVCKVGKDVFGEKSLEGYRKEGIDISNVIYSDKPSGVALIMVDDNGENCISVAPGANSDITPDDILKISDVIRNAGFVVLQLEIPVETVLAAARIAHEAGAYVILNPAPACKLPAELFKYVSLATPNQTEIALMTGIENDVDAAMEKLQDMGVHDIILTLGSKGSAIKKLGTDARASIEDFLQKHIFLDLSVKVLKDWRNSDLLMKKFGYDYGEK